MSVKSQAWVWGKRGLGPYGKLVLMELADHLGRDDAVVWPSLRAIAARTEISISSIRRVVTQLENLGLIVCFEKVGGHGTTSLLFVLNVEDLEPSEFLQDAITSVRGRTEAFLRPRMQAQRDARERQRQHREARSAQARLDDGLL